MEYAINEIRNMEYEKGNTGHSPDMKSGIWDQENYPILEYGKREKMKLEIWSKVILTFELGNLQGLLRSPKFKAPSHGMFLLYVLTYRFRSKLH